MNTELWPLISYSVCIKRSIHFHAILQRRFHQVIGIMQWRTSIQWICLYSFFICILTLILLETKVISHWHQYRARSESSRNGRWIILFVKFSRLRVKYNKYKTDIPNPDWACVCKPYYPTVWSNLSSIHTRDDLDLPPLD